jgi:succinate--hydroxymethylglutarate CoA-transferase
LSGVRILDLTRVLAVRLAIQKEREEKRKTTDIGQGPFCTQILADYGAKVLKVENPKGGVWKEVLFNHSLNRY